MDEETCTAILDTVVNFLGIRSALTGKSIKFERRQNHSQVVEIDGKKFAIHVDDLSYDDIPF